MGPGTEQPSIGPITPVTGNWFGVRYDYSTGTECFLVQIIAWARMDCSVYISHVCGIGDNGMPVEGDAIRYVPGEEIAPNGKDWNTVYAQRGANLIPSHNITALMEEG